MQTFAPAEVERSLLEFAGEPAYLHLETTAGAYTKDAVGAFVRNASIRFRQAAVRGEGPYRVGLRLEHGWVYADGLTEWEVDGEGRLLLAGRDKEERLTVVLELSRTPFPA